MKLGEDTVRLFGMPFIGRRWVFSEGVWWLSGFDGRTIVACGHRGCWRHASRLDREGECDNGPRFWCEEHAPKGLDEQGQREDPTEGPDTVRLRADGDAPEGRGEA